MIDLIADLLVVILVAVDPTVQRRCRLDLFDAHNLATRGKDLQGASAKRPPAVVLPSARLGMATAYISAGFVRWEGEMKRWLIVGTWVAGAVPSGASAGEPTAEGKSAVSVIDIEFWGRQQIRSADPYLQNQDVITYGDPVQGKFRIWTEDAPPPNQTSIFLDSQDAAVYGRDTSPVGNPPPTSFVTSDWLSAFPPGFASNVSPFPGGEADDRVTIGDSLHFVGGEPLKDWFAVSDSFTERFGLPGEYRNELSITVTTPIDSIQGVGLGQEFELVTPVESGSAGYGFFRARYEDTVKFFAFAVERLRVSKVSVCRP